MSSRFDELIEKMKKLSHEERKERVKALVRAWREHERRRQEKGLPALSRD
ncbi:MAG: hypothetical protein ACUVTD_03920 [Nitrososphaerales archaeon]